jgi:hypothetical protein
VLFVHPSTSFDVQAWAGNPGRQLAFRLLGIKRLVVEQLQEGQHAAS